MSPSPLGTRRLSGLFLFAMGACAVYYIFIIFSCPGDFQGDSWDYLNIAARDRAHVISYSYQRGLFYPWFLAATWGLRGLTTYLVQAGLFLGSLYQRCGSSRSAVLIA